MSDKSLSAGANKQHPEIYGAEKHRQLANPRRNEWAKASMKELMRYKLGLISSAAQTL